MAIITQQPFKALYTLMAVVFEACRFPIWQLMYTLSAGRPHKNWTRKQAVRVRVVRAFLFHSSQVKVKTPLSLKAGSEKDRFVVLEPANPNLYAGLAKDNEVKPLQLGGTWYPVPFLASEAKVETEDVLLHFHGGAFVIGDGRDADAGYLCRMLIKHVGFRRAFAPQYRLSSNPGCRFPSQLQDAITAYSYLLNELHYPAHRITVSGDSAGGNLVLALLRYIAEHGSEVGLPAPGCAFLWSPWVNMDNAKDPAKISTSPHYLTDYLTSDFGAWGSSTYAGPFDSDGPYFSPIFHPFATATPIFIQTGGAEVLYHDDVELAKKYGDVKGNVVELLVAPNAPHDIALIGKLLGFEKDFDGCAEKARDFYQQNRLSNQVN